MRRTKIFACLLAVGLASCGGGGGDGGGSASADPTASFPQQTALTYSGAATPAAVSATNAGVLAANVFGASASGTAGGIATGVSAEVTSSAGEQPTGVAGIGRRLAKAIRAGDLGRPGGGALSGARIDQTTPCDSGAMRIFGDVSDSNGTGTVTVHYLACRTGADTVNGPAQLQIVSNSGSVMTDGTLSFTRLNFSGPGINADMTGSIRSQISTTSTSATETLTQNTVMLDNATGRMTQAQNVRITNVYDDVDSPSFFTQNITGTVCESVAGCVGIQTNTVPFTAPWGPLYYSTIGQSFPDWGEMVLTGATSSRVRVTSLGTTVAKVEVDADGDGTYETSSRMRWLDFDTAIGANLRDTDGDGMHNSWETAKGLSASSANANADSDGDGFSDFVEYLNGSEPLTSGSIPGPVRRLWVTNVSDLGVDPSGQLQVFVNSSSSGVLLDPVTRELGAAFSGATAPGNGSSVTDAQGRTFTLSPTASPTVWTITSSTGASITVTNVAGTGATSLVRYGTRGLAFRTIGAASPGYVYLVESTQLIP